jgi:hypothetical protein
MRDDTTPVAQRRHVIDGCLRRERSLWIARGGAFVLLVAAAWTLFVWPDARRAPVSCVVTGHRNPAGGKNGHHGLVYVKAGEEERSFRLISGFSTMEERERAFAEWPIGATRTCWKLPYPSPEGEQITGDGASWIPSIVLALGGLLSLAWGTLRSREPPLARDRVPEHPFRVAASGVSGPGRLVIDERAASPRARRVAWFALAFWILLFGCFFGLAITAPTPAGSILEPGSLARAGMGLFVLIALIIPGGFLFWPATYVLLARVTVRLDGKARVLGVSRGVPGLRSTRWQVIPSGALVVGLPRADDRTSPLVGLHQLSPGGQQAVQAWLTAWSDQRRE